MFDTPHVPLSSVAAACLWLLGLALVVLELILELTGSHGQWVAVGELGLLAGMGGATLTVRGYFCRFANRENDAFALGREVGRSEDDGLRRLR